MDINALYTLIISFFIVFNSVGYAPVFLALLKPFDHARQKKIIVREVTIAYFIIVLFIFFGARILEFIGISEATIGLAGGLLLVLISLNLIFPKEDVSDVQKTKNEPFIVPLAMPGLAGPGTIAASMLFASQHGMYTTALAFTIAWVPSLFVLYIASYLRKILGDKGLYAIEKFGGMLICLIGMNMVALGAVNLVKENFPQVIPPPQEQTQAPSQSS